MASSLDGKINLAGGMGHFVMSRHAEDATRLRNLRQKTDTLIIGASNVRVDDPDLSPSTRRVVVTHEGDGLDARLRIFSPPAGGETIVAHTSAMPESRREEIARVATLWSYDGGGVDIVSLLERLARERDAKLVLCEGGGGLNASFFEANVIDELYLTIVPRILGGVLASTIVSGAGFGADEIREARLVSCEQVGDELFLRYEFPRN